MSDFNDKIGTFAERLNKAVNRQYDKTERMVERKIRAERIQGNHEKADRMEERLQEFRSNRPNR